MHCLVYLVDNREGLRRRAGQDVDPVRDRPAASEHEYVGTVTVSEGGVDGPGAERCQVDRVYMVSWSTVALRSAVELRVWPGFLLASERHLPTGYLAQRKTGAQSNGG